MDYDNWKFTTKNKNGEDVECDIITTIESPTSSDYEYVVFNDGTVDENDNIVFMYGKLYKNDDEYELHNNVNDAELVYIKKMLGPKITQHILDAFKEGEE